MKKAILSLLCALVCVLCAFAASPALAANIASGMCGNCDWWIEGDGTLNICPQSGTDGVLGAPDADPSAPWPWLKNGWNAKIKDVDVYIGVKAGSSLHKMFYQCTNLDTFNLISLDTSATTDMSGMFQNCTNLSFVPSLVTLDTSNVTNMESMFSGCSNLSALNLWSLYTPQVTNIRSMFNGCSSLSTLNLGGLNTSNVTNMENMLSGCTELTSLTMGADCKLTTAAALPVDRWYKLGSLQQMSAGEMFASHNAGGEDASYYYDATIDSSLVGGCSWKLDTAGKLTIFPADGGNGRLPDGANKNNYDDVWPWLNYAKFIQSVEIAPGVKAGNSLFCMFYHLYFLSSADVSNLDVSSTQDMSFMFNGCPKLTKLDLTGWDTSSVTNMKSMFAECYNLTELNLSSFNTSNVTKMSYMFLECRSLKELDVSHFDTGKVTEMRSMFMNCRSLKELDVTNFDTSSAIELAVMFEGCSGLTELDVTNFDTSKTQAFEAMFKECTGLTQLDLSNFDTSNATYMGYMFKGCTGLTELDLSNFDTRKVYSMYNMFSDCSALTKLNLGSFVTDDEVELSFHVKNAKLSVLTLGKDCKVSGTLPGEWYDLSDPNQTAISNVITHHNTHPKSTTYVRASQTNYQTGASGGCGFTIDKDGHFVLFPLNGISGTLASHAGYTEWEWHSYRNLITSVAAEKGTRAGTRMGQMFAVCPQLAKADLSNLENTQNTTDMNSLFNDCRKLKEVHFGSNWNTSNVTSMKAMFYNCRNLASLDLSRFDTSNATDMQFMFLNTPSLKKLTLGAKCRLHSNVIADSSINDWYPEGIHTHLTWPELISLHNKQGITQNYLRGPLPVEPAEPSVPSTGDSTPVALYGMLAMLSMLTAVWMLRRV